MRGINTSIPFQIAVIIISHVGQVIEILIRITQALGLIHCLDTEVVIRIDGKLLLRGTDTRYAARSGDRFVTNTMTVTLLLEYLK